MTNIVYELVMSKKRNLPLSLHVFPPKFFTKLLFFGYYFIPLTLIIAIRLFPNIDSCGVDVCYFGPITSFLWISNLPGMYILSYLDIISGIFIDDFGLFSLLIFFSLFLVATIPTALLLLFVGKAIDSRLKRIAK